MPPFVHDDVLLWPLGERTAASVVGRGGLEDLEAARGVEMAITVTSNEEPASMRQRRTEEALDPATWLPRGPDSALFSPATRWRDRGRAPSLCILPPVERAAGHRAVSDLL